MSTSPFDYVNDVSHGKKDIIRNSPNPEIAESEYNSWIINKTLSYFEDTILYANEMNKNYHLSNLQQFDYFLNSINKRKRFSKQAKTVVSQDVKAVSEYFGYSYKKAEEVLSILTAQEVQTIKQKLETGG
ncbi:MAG: DNA polymerase clamp loader subunit A [Actinomycetes bacterium]|jgi:hypothetical protein